MGFIEECRLTGTSRTVTARLTDPPRWKERLAKPIRGTLAHRTFQRPIVANLSEPNSRNSSAWSHPMTVTSTMMRGFWYRSDMDPASLSTSRPAKYERQKAHRDHIFLPVGF